MVAEKTAKNFRGPLFLLHPVVFRPFPPVLLPQFSQNPYTAFRKWVQACTTARTTGCKFCQSSI